MLAPRNFVHFSAASHRFFASSSLSTVSRLTRDDVQFIPNPNDKYMNAFMKAHGSDRTVFKKEDISQWKNSFDDDYTFQLMCLKGTTRVIATTHTCNFRPLKSSSKPILFMGFGWIDPELRAAGVAKMLNEMCLNMVESTETNVVSHINQNGRQFWHLMCGMKELDDVGHGALEVGYNSFYEAENVRIPKNLDLSGITVNNAKDVPKKDIIDYDQKVHPYHRERYIISHLHDPDGFGKVAYDEDGKVCGIGQAVIYPAGDCNLGPIYADSPRIAQAMFVHMLQDIAASGKKVTCFEVRSGQLAKDSFHWIAPFLTCQPKRHQVSNLVYRNWAPKSIDFSKVYSPTHAQLFLV